MPARYDGIKRSFLEKGYSEKEAKTAAAKIYNSTRKHNEPTLAGYDKKKKKKKK